jgi:hypothetical protein
MKVFDRLKNRIKKDLNIDADRFERTYAGINMQASGAHKWRCYYVGTNKSFGSCYTASELLKNKSKLILEQGYPSGELRTDSEIFPSNSL